MIIITASWHDCRIEHMDLSRYVGLKDWDFIEIIGDSRMVMQGAPIFHTCLLMTRAHSSPLEDGNARMAGFLLWPSTRRWRVGCCFGGLQVERGREGGREMPPRPVAREKIGLQLGGLERR